jgi:glycosyltransferase involved in cell wall biosynthesis
MKTLKVVHLLGGLYPSGMERMLSSAAEDFRNQNVEAVIIGQGPTHPFMPSLVEAGYGVHIIPRVRTLAGFKALQKVLRSERPDIVHIHTESAFMSAVFSSRLVSPAPIIRTIHSVFRPNGRALISRRIQSFLADRFVAQFVSPSPDVAENEAKMGRNSQVIYNWVSSEYIEAGLNDSILDRDPRLATLVGNCAPVKNHEMALRHLLASGYSVAHHGDESNASPEEVLMLDELALSGRLEYRGTDAPIESLRRSGVFVLSSLHEGMSVALAEAIAAGTPCLVADSTGLSWAKGIDSVQHISLENQEDWASALPESGYAVTSGSGDALDLSSKRGAAEYGRLYHRLSGNFQASGDAEADFR